MNRVKITGINTNELPKLNGRESQEMLLRIKNGEVNLRETFLMANARLVLSMVQRFINTKENPDDLFQIGMIGLIKATDNFDVSLNVRFSTYAVPMVLGEIRRFIRESTAMKVGRNLRDIAYKAMIARDKLERAEIREAELDEIADEIKVPYSEVVFALDAIAEPVSIYETAFSDTEEGTMIIDQISDCKEHVDCGDLLALHEGINDLPDKERVVIIFRYYRGLTQAEIAETLAMSQAQVSRLEKSALSRLRPAIVVAV
ncbi:MAG: sigma-70 family RNA polymerase sigma factor [Christensenellaceae bacterium]|jgi:RNA polymerase sporulation-specific sigma factor|nr:sigma-70 family RNA polymerase sigma factor [Christensenellaceae bacterium]